MAYSSSAGHVDPYNQTQDHAHWRPVHHHDGAHGSPLDRFFEKKDLPMYKDKPYNYPASTRYVPIWRRKRILALVALCFILAYRFLLGRSSSKVVPEYAVTEQELGSMINKATSNEDWNLRRDAVREVFKSSWDSYETYAWGMDEFHPISKNGRLMTQTGMGWIIVDALDTLIIMNLTSRLVHAREWVSTSLNYSQDHDVNTFETTIRMLGGLLSAHYLSNTYPNLAPLKEDDIGQAGEDLYIEKAVDLADRLLGAFDSPSGVPYASVNPATRKGIVSHVDGGASSTAEASTLQLEFKYLSMLIGESLYWEKAEHVIQVIDDNNMEDGLLPIYIHPDTGQFRGDNIRLGSRGDSYYEYLIKQYLQTAKEEPVYKELWDEALAGVRKHLITYSKESRLTVLAERPSGLHRPLSPKMDHLVCFMPGTILLGATEGLTVSQARKANRWGPKQEGELHLARELSKTCWGMYKAMATGLAAEITFFAVDEPPLSERDGPMTSEKIDWHATSEEAQKWRSDFIIKDMDSHNLQRPETVESLFYMYRLTGDDIYREWGWEMFQSFVQYERLDDGAFTSLSHGNRIPPETKDNMESFWLAETLKYFYLLFSPVDLLPLDEVVFNTEAHVFPIFKLQRGLKTGWKRKPRDADGKIIQDASV